MAAVGGRWLWTERTPYTCNNNKQRQKEKTWTKLNAGQFGSLQPLAGPCACALERVRGGWARRANGPWLRFYCHSINLIESWSGYTHIKIVCVCVFWRIRYTVFYVSSWIEQNGCIPTWLLLLAFWSKVRFLYRINRNSTINLRALWTGK